MNEKLRRVRLQRHWSIEKAAEQIGVSRLTYIRWEQGVQTPHISTLLLACTAFQLPAEELGFHNPVPDLAAQPEEEQQAVISTQMAVMPVPSVLSQEMLLRLTAQSLPGQQQAAVGLAYTQEIGYDWLEVEIMTKALQWRQTTDSLAFLQQFVVETLRNYDTMHNHHDSQETSITRRHALQAIALLPIQFYGLTHLPGNTPARKQPPAEALPLCAAGLTACWELRQYEPEGLHAIQRILAAYLPTLETLAQHSSPAQHQAASLAAQGYLLTWCLADYAGKFDQMEAAGRMARFHAQVAHDINSEVAALARLAVTFDYEQRDIKSLETYQEALHLPEFRRVSPLLQSRVYAGLAGASAYCQQNIQAISYLNQAKEIYPAVPEADPGFTFAVYGRSALALWEGLTWEYTGHYPEAVQAFSQFGRTTSCPGLLEESRSAHLNYTASVAVRQRDLEMASFYLDTAEEVAYAIHHEQRLAEVSSTLREMQLLWPDEPEVRHLQEKMYSRQG